MIREIIRDPVFLAIPSTNATSDDQTIIDDLFDTLIANRDHCVGIAANMIGYSKRIIVVDDHGTYRAFRNPEIIDRRAPYEVAEGCLSFSEKRKTIRYRKIRIRYDNEQFLKRIQTFEGWTAQIIQHEIDHCDGILI